MSCLNCGAAYRRGRFCIGCGRNLYRGRPVDEGTLLVPRLPGNGRRAAGRGAGVPK
jgi:hypothetical protein